MGVPSKLIWLILFAVGGTSFVIYRKIMSVVDKSSISGLINSLRKNSAKVKDIVEALDIPYGKRENFSREDFDKLKSAVHTATKIDDYTILYQTDVDALQCLLITEIAFSDFDIGVTGESTDVKKKAYHSFVLRFEPESKILSVWSDLYNDTTSKFQKETFSKRTTGTSVETT